MMSDYKIAFFGVKPWEREVVEKEITKLDTYGIGLFSGEVADKWEIAEKYEILSITTASKINREALEKLPKLKMIAARSTGVDHIDLEECKKRKIVVKNVPKYASNTVAEFAVGLLLAVTKKIVMAQQSVEEGEYSPMGLTGVDIGGKTLGVIGFGKIGQRVAKLALGLGMKVVVVDVIKKKGITGKMRIKFVTLEECLKTADFVSLHVPYLPTTHHLVNRENIKLMKKGSYLINTARGQVVETEAVIWALNKGILAGAGLDVVEEADLCLLRDRDDVVVTPHTAFNTVEAIERRIKANIETISKFCHNKGL